MAVLPPMPSIQEGNNAPWTVADDVVPNDDNDLPYHSRGLYVGTGGDVVVTMSGNSDSTITGKRTFANVVDGTFLPITVRRVWADSTASDMVSGT